MKRWLLAFLLSALLLLAGCGGTASDGASSNAVDGEANDAAASQVLTEGAEALTDDELAQAQEAFASERYDEAPEPTPPRRSAVSLPPTMTGRRSCHWRSFAILPQR